MSITYPLSLPSVFAMAQLTIRQNSTVGASTSPFSADQQLYVHQGQWWEADVQLPPMKRDDAEEILAVFLSLRGREGFFLMGDPVGRVPRGSAGGAPVVDGAGQGGLSLAVRGAPVSTTGWLKSGDWLQIGSGSTARLHKTLTRADTDADGKVTLDIWPRLRYSPSNGQAIVLTGAVGQWRLASNTTEYTIKGAMQYGYAFAAREKLP